jgi:hypothetical protein
MIESQEDSISSYLDSGVGYIMGIEPLLSVLLSNQNRGMLLLMAAKCAFVSVLSKPV